MDLQIPPRYGEFASPSARQGRGARCRAQSRARKDGTGRYVGLTASLRTLLKAGDKVEVPIAQEKNVSTRAQAIGMKVATRRLGSTTTVTVFRVE